MGGERDDEDAVSIKLEAVWRKPNQPLFDSQFDV